MTDYSISFVSANYFSMHRIIQVIAIVAVYYRLKWNEERHIQCFTLNRDNRQWNDQSGGLTSVTIFVADAHVSGRTTSDAKVLVSLLARA